MLNQDQINVITVDEIDEFLRDNGFPNKENSTLIDRIKSLMDSIRPSQTMFDLQIRHDALVGRLVPYMAIGETEPSETLSRLIRYIQQLEKTNSELQQEINRLQ